MSAAIALKRKTNGEKRISEKVPALKLITSGLSIKVDGTRGSITDGELPKCKEFGKRITDQLKA